MGAFKKAVVTNKGQALLAKAIAGTTKLEFTKIAVSENVLAGEPVDRTDIGTIKQAKPATSILKDDNNNVRVSVGFNNSELTVGYFVRNVGLFATDPDEGEILYSVSIADETTQIDYMPPFTGVGVSSLVLDLVVELSSNPNVEVVVEDTTQATVGQVLALEQRLNNLTPASIGATTPEYVDSQIALITETGIPKLMVYPLMVTAGEDNQTVFPITLETFDIKTDNVFVQSGRTMLFPEHDFTVRGNTVVLNEGVPFGRTLGIYIFKNMPLGDEGSVTGAVIAPNSLPLDRLEKMPVSLYADPVISKSTDWDNLACGTYRFSTWGGSGGTGYPPIEDVGICILFETANGKYMYCLGMNRIVSRYYESKAWSDWKDGYLPITGGTITGSSLDLLGGYGRWQANDKQTLLTARNTETGTTRGIQIHNDTANTTLSGAYKFLNYDGNEWKYYNIFGEHNKPHGSYTGNGSETSRTINVGGIGDMLFIRSSKGCVLVTGRGSIAWNGSTASSISTTYATFTSGVLTLKSTDEKLNYSGIEYTYVLL